MRAFLSQASSTGSRSTALQPLVWLIAILISGLLYAATRAVPEWVLIALAIFLGIAIFLYMTTYGYFALKNVDALRSEKYTLSKMAIEKNLIGDNRVGLQEIGNFETHLSSPTLTDKGASAI